MAFQLKSGGSIAAAALFLALLIGGAGSSEAQTATDLDCKGCVGKKELGTKAVGKQKIRTNAIRNRHYNNYSISKQKLMKDAVGTDKIQDNAVSSSKLKAGAVTAEKMAASAQPAGIAYSSGDQDTLIGGAPTIFRTVTINAPDDGFVMVNASWVIYGRDITTSCSISTGSTVSSTHEVVIEEGDFALVHLSGAAVRAFPVSAGNNTFNLVCSASVGAPRIRDSALIATYVPQEY